VTCVCVLLEYYVVLFSVRSTVLPLAQYASTHPVTQVIMNSNTEQVLANRQQTLDSIVHQADQVLRKCVSKKITAFQGKG